MVYTFKFRNLISSLCFSFSKPDHSWTTVGPRKEVISRFSLYSFFIRVKHLKLFLIKLIFLKHDFVKKIFQRKIFLSQNKRRLKYVHPRQHMRLNSKRPCDDPFFFFYIYKYKRVLTVA